MAGNSNQDFIHTATLLFSCLTKGFGSKILKRFGWKEGQPIGKNSLGLVLPLYCEENGQFDGKPVRIIIPFGTILELNIGNDLTIPGEIVPNEIAKAKDVPQFMDISRSDDDEDCIRDTPKNGKRTNDSETDEDENDKFLSMKHR